MSLSWVDKEIEELEELGIERKLFSFNHQEFLNFSSNDYLNFSANPKVIQAAKLALEKYGLGSCSARLLSGNTDIHENVEEKLRNFFQSEEALVYSSGYLVNLGVISTIVSRNDFVISDKLIHASLIDAIKLSSAKHFRFRHNDLNHLEDILKKLNQEPKIAKKLIVVESIYSMDGDGPELKELLILASKYDCILLVDEAHAFGVFGRAGRGCMSDQVYDQSSIIITSNFSKSIGAYGGFVICSKSLKRLLLSRSRPFIFNTSLPAVVLAGAGVGIDLLSEYPNLGKELLANAKYLRVKLCELGLNTLRSFSQIIPILIGDNSLAKKIAKDFYQMKIFLPAIVSPTVKTRDERLRISITLAHSKADLDALIENIKISTKDAKLI